MKKLLFYKYEAKILPQITLIGKSQYISQSINIRRVSEDYIFYIITYGEMYVNEDGKEYCLKAGDCFLFEPGKLHFGTKKSRYSFMFIHFKHSQIEKINLSEEEWLLRAENENRRWNGDIVGNYRNLNGSVLEGGNPKEKSIFIPKYVSFGSANVFSTICHLADKAIDQHKTRRENYNTVAACATSELFIEIYRYLVSAALKNSNSGSVSNKRISSVISYLYTNYARNLTGEIIEKELSYNFDYLNQLFKKNLNITIFQMLTNIRISVAKNLMITSTLPIKSIAEQIGFRDQSYFSKIFKKHTGYTPKQYIKKYHNFL